MNERKAMIDRLVSSFVFLGFFLAVPPAWQTETRAAAAEKADVVSVPNRGTDNDSAGENPSAGIAGNDPLPFPTPGFDWPLPQATIEGWINSGDPARRRPGVVQRHRG